MKISFSDRKARIAILLQIQRKIKETEFRFSNNLDHKNRGFNRKKVEQTREKMVKQKTSKQPVKAFRSWSQSSDTEGIVSGNVRVDIFLRYVFLLGVCLCKKVEIRKREWEREGRIVHFIVMDNQHFFFFWWSRNNILSIFIGSCTKKYTNYTLVLITTLLLIVTCFTMC